MSPFSFEFDFSAGFDVSFEGTSLCGLHVDGLFSGPRPWHLHGDASIDILFFSVSVSLDLTWGDSTPAILPQKPVLPDLLPGACRIRATGVRSCPAIPRRRSRCRRPSQTTRRCACIPSASSACARRLCRSISRSRATATPRPPMEICFAISDVQINNVEEARQPIQDYFAAGQFLSLSDADKVSAPSFEKYDAGVTIGSSNIVAGSDSPRTVVYEERYIDEPTGFSRFARLYAMPANIHLAMSRQGAGFASPLKNSGLFKYGAGVSGSAVKTADPSYVITQRRRSFACAATSLLAAGSTYFQARAALDSYLAIHPEESSNLQIQPLHEVAA